MKSRLGYLFGGFLIAFAFAVAGLALGSAMSTMGGMQRVVMPGTAQITLPNGPSTLYLETKSKVGDREIASTGDFVVECSIQGLQLVRPASTVRYSLGGYRGHNAYDVTVASGGRYELTCGPATVPPFAIAIGSGVGAWIVIAVLAVIPLLAGIALVVVTMIRRRRARAPIGLGIDSRDPP